MKIFIINLKQSVDRREALTKELDKLGYQQGIDYEFIEAVNGKELDNPQQYLDTDKCITRVKRLMTTGEIGCYLSHLNLWKKIRDEKIERACILEDDICPTVDFPKVLKELEATPDDSLYYLHRYHNDTKPFLPIKKLNKTHQLGIYKWHDLGAQGYVLGAQTAKQLCNCAEAEPLCYELDRLLYRSWSHGIPTLHINPPVINMIAMPSTLQDDRQQEGRSSNTGKLVFTPQQKLQHRLWKIKDSTQRRFWLIKQWGLKKFLQLSKLK